MIINPIKEYFYLCNVKLKVMKTRVKLLFVALTACLIAACSEKPVSPDTPYIIEGEVPNMEDSIVVTLLEDHGSIYEIVARDTVMNGKFRFEEPVKEGWTHLGLSIHEGKYGGGYILSIHVEPGAQIKITGHNHYVNLWDVDSPNPRQKLNNELRNAAREEIKAFVDLENEMTNETHVLHSMAEANRIGAAYQAIIGKQLQHMMGMKVSEAWMEEVLFFADFNSRQENFPHHKLFESLYEKLSDSQKQSLLGKDMYAKINPPEQARVGEAFPDADLYDLQGNLHHISEFKGKYILLDFWSRGCGPCLQSFPKMKELYEEMGDKLEIISISVDPEKHWRIASEKHELTWNNWNELNGKSGLYTKYRIRGIPFYVLISPEGKIMETIMSFSKDYIIDAIT